MPHIIKKIYIIRHGETEYNRQGIVQGSGVDSELNETGLEQAKSFYEYYKNEKFDKIYTSTLRRTHQSVANFINHNNWQQDPALNEISWGKREGKIPDQTDNIQFEAITKDWSKGNTHLKFENGESPNDVAIRQNAFIENSLKNPDNQIILVAMHGRALKILLSKIIHNNLSKMDHFHHSNLCLYLLHYNSQTDTFEIIKKNNIDHLRK
jgi:2,3-bisphosphoglycerate-dependent phosphoglycerate mutase